MLGFAALVHELTGRVASVLMLSKDLTVHANRHDPTWLDERLARVYRAASEMQRNMDAVKRLETDSPPERTPVHLSTLAARVLQGQLERTPELAWVTIRIPVEHPGGGRHRGNRDCLEQSHRQCVETLSASYSPRATCDCHERTASYRCARQRQMGRHRPRGRLAVCRRIVERHGGRIWATGEPGLGTTVSFHL